MSNAELFSTSFRGYDKSEVTAFITNQSENAEAKEKALKEEIEALSEENAELQKKIDDLIQKQTEITEENDAAIKTVTDNFNADKEAYEKRIKELEEKLLEKEENTRLRVEDAQKEADMILESARLQKRVIIDAANADATVVVGEKISYLKERIAKFNEILDTFDAKQQIIDSGFEQARRHLAGINAMMDQMIKNG